MKNCGNCNNAHKIEDTEKLYCIAMDKFYPESHQCDNHYPLIIEAREDI